MTRADQAPLSAIADVIRGVTFSKKDVKQNPGEGFAPVLRAGNIQDKLLLQEDLVFVSEAMISPKQRLRAGDIVMCTSSGSADVVGKTGYVERDWDGSFGAFCAAIRAREGECLPKYLFHYLQTPEFRAWTSSSSGINIKNIRKSELDSVLVPLPPIEQQGRITAILDKAQSIRRRRDEALALVDVLLKSTFIEMFGDPSTNSRNWPMATIRELLLEAKYGTSQKADTVQGRYPILRMGNLTYEGEIDISDLKYVDLADGDVEKYTVKKGDILFNRTNSSDLVGKTAVFQRDEPYAYAGYLVRARVNGLADPHYISNFLNSDFGKSTLKGMCKSIIGMANINAQEFQNIKIPVPPVELQRAFGVMVERIDVTRAKLRGELKSAEHLFASLSQSAFSGGL